MKRALATFASIVYSNPNHTRGDGSALSGPSGKTENRREKRKSNCIEHDLTTISADAGKRRRIVTPRNDVSLDKNENPVQLDITQAKKAISPPMIKAGKETVLAEIDELSEITLPNLSSEIPDSLASSSTLRNYQGTSKVMKMIPPEVLGHCLLFLPQSNRMSLLCVSKDFLKICNSNIFLRNLELGGEPLTGRGGFILKTDTRETAVERLYPLFRAGNLTACHMIGILKAYCFNQVEIGIQFLKAASDNGYIRSSYSLGLILRDTCKKESVELLVQAANKGYLPALQELLPAKEMKENYGEPSAEELGAYFDLVGLGYLLSRYYSSYPRSNPASHCWNEFCGRWAYKSEKNGGHGGVASSMHSRPVRATITIQSSETSTETIHDDFSAATMPTKNSQQSSTRCSLQPNGSLGIFLPGAHRLSRMKMCSSCRRAKYCSKLCQVYDWRSGRHKKECRRI